MPPVITPLPPSAAASRRRAGDWLWFLLWAGLSSAWCITASTQLSAAFDEPNYLANGLEVRRSGSYKLLMRQGTMPLPVDVMTLPLHWWEKAHGQMLALHSNSHSVPVELNDLDVVLPWARLGNLLFWWVLLFYGWSLAWRIGGPWAGRLAVAALACEPNLLGHATLATTDMAVAACLLALLFHFQGGRERGWLLRVGLPALWFGLAVLAKASALMFAPLAMLGLELHRILQSGVWRQPGGPSAGGKLRTLLRRLRPLGRDLRGILLGGLLLAFLYVGTDWKPEPSFVEWAHKLPPGRWASAMTWTAEHLCLFTNAGEGLAFQIRHNVLGHGAYILGQAYPRAVWWYFPVALTMKLAAPVLAGLLALLVLRPRKLWNGAVAAAAILLLFSVTFRVQIGIRFLLPAIALLVIGLAAAVAHVHRDSRAGWRSRGVAVLALTGALWMGVTAARTWPDGLCFINEAWGGSDAGYRLLSDSNYDWGQGLKDLDHWRRNQGLAELDVWYFGMDPAADQPPFRSMRFQTLPISGPQDALARVSGRFLAVSTSLLYNSSMGDEDSGRRGLRDTCEYFRAQRFVARTRTFLIYDLHPDRGPATTHPEARPDPGAGSSPAAESPHPNGAP